MKGEAPERRRENLKKLRVGAGIWHRFYVLVLITGFPLLTQGTEIHEYAVMLRNFGILGACAVGMVGCKEFLPSGSIV